MTLMQKLGAEPESGKLFLGLALLVAGGVATENQARFAPGEVVVARAVSSSRELVCTQEVHECEGGAFVSRDPARGCEFRACPEVKTPRP